MLACTSLSPPQVGVLTSRKSSSTPSLSDVMDSRASVASTDQASSAENLTSSIKAVSTGNLRGHCIFICPGTFFSYFLQSFLVDERSEVKGQAELVVKSHPAPTENASLWQLWLAQIPYFFYISRNDFVIFLHFSDYFFLKVTGEIFFELYTLKMLFVGVET